MSEGIRVRAIRNGFIGAQLKIAGSEFTLLKPELFSKTWMEKIPQEAPKSVEAESEIEDVVPELTARRRRRAAE
jgi:hypothetical protein